MGQGWADLYCSSVVVLRYCLMIVEDILLENEVTSVSPRGDDGSDVKIISANTRSSGGSPFLALA